MLESKEFRSSVMPIIVANSIFCTGLFEYYNNRSTHVIGIIYIFITTSIYCTVFSALLNRLSSAWYSHMSSFSLLTVHFQVYSNILVYSSTVLAGIIRSKQIRLSMKHLENCTRAMNDLGIPGSYSALITHKYLTSLCVFLILISTTFGELYWLLNSNFASTLMVLFCITENVPPVASFIVNLSFVYWIRYTKMKLGQLNTVLRSMLTTTIESPQHRRVLRIRDKWKDTSPSSSIYRNYKTDENIKKLKRIKEIHLELIKFARNINEAYGLHILLSMTTCFLLITTLLYNLYVSMVSNEFTMSLADIVIYAYWIGFLSIEVIVVNHMCATAAMEVREFVQQLIQNPLTFTACGFFDLDHTFINGTIGSVTTYLVILIQVGRGTGVVSGNTTEISTSTV